MSDLRTLEDVEIQSKDTDEWINKKKIRSLASEWKEYILKLRDKPHNGQTSDFYDGMLAVLDNLHNLEDKDIILREGFGEVVEEDE